MLSLMRHVGSMLTAAYVAVSCTPATTAAAAAGAEASFKQAGIDPVLSLNDTLADVLSLPELKPFARYLLPLEHGYDPKLPLSEMERLLPYHNFVSASRGVAIINDFIARSRDGQRLWYPLSHQDSGLFFLPGKPGAPFAVICPGGGFAYVGSIHEGFPYALELNELGLNAFVLQYRTGSGQRACADLAEALAYIFAHAAEFQVDVKGYALIGSSAGARMAAVLGAYGTQYFNRPQLPLPAAVIMAYTGYDSYSSSDRPTYSVCGDRDYIASASLMAARIKALQNLGIPAQIKIYPGLPHGFGTGEGTGAAGWLKDAVAFWLQQRQAQAAPQGTAP